MNDHPPPANEHFETRNSAAAPPRDNEDRYRTFFESTDEGLCIIEAEPSRDGGPEDYRLVAVNPAFGAVTGAAQALGLTIREVFPRLYQEWIDAYGEVLATGSAVRFESWSGARILEIHAFRVEDGTNRRIGAIFADVTTRKRVEEARDESERALQRLNETLEDRIEQRTAKLLAREALIRTFFNHSSECHAVLVDAQDGSFRYEEVNPATLRLYKMRREEVIGFTTNEIFGAENAAEVNMHLAACLRSGKPYRYERKQGDGIVEAIATPVLDQIVPAARIVVSARDVTERRRLEEQLRQAQKMEAIGQLTGGIAHDFNNLLTGIIGGLEMMQRRISQGRFDGAERYIGAARDAASRAAALTQRLLAFSRRQTLDPKPTNINKLVAGIEELLRQTVGPGTELEIVTEEGLWLTRIDPSQLENAVLNLSINARDAMPNGGRITIETANKWLDDDAARERDLSPGQYVLISVADTGTGMTQDVISQAFDPFFTTKPLGLGTGLGLSMIHGFVRQSGGGIRIASEVGRGTKMYLYLPRILGEVEDHAGTDDFRTAGAGHGEVVLVIDDDPIVRMLMVEVMREAGYAVLDAGDGVAALRILQSDRRIDLLITDVGLPGGMNGRQVADAARTWRPALKVLFVTGYAENAAIGNGQLDEGMRVITKPFAVGALENKVREMIEG
jgi:PAS domain S-box-containing protein